MTPYQSFPDAPGESRSLEKLKALHLPSLRGRSFLDVGCAEGFFCGYAHFDGARRVVGLDLDGTALARARSRFPECEFIEQSLEHLPDERFDVILLASVMHYAPSQPDLIRAAVERLTDDGVLVIEAAVASSVEGEWVRFRRGLAGHVFPSSLAMRELLQPYAWRHIGPSVPERGHPVARHVYHVRRRIPYAYLLLQAPTFGKSTLARVLFAKAGVQVLSGDDLLHRVVRGTLDAPEALASAIRAGFSPQTIDQTMERLFSSGFAAALVDFFLRQAEHADLALDAFVPQRFHREVEAAFRAAGFVPVLLQWDRVGPALLDDASIAQRADDFLRAIGGTPGAVEPAPGQRLPFKGTTGYVDHVDVQAGRLRLRGWALCDTHRPPAMLAIRVGDAMNWIEDFRLLRRPDVQKHFGLTHAECGFDVTVESDASSVDDALRAGIELFGGNRRDQMDGPFQWSKPLAQKLVALRPDDSITTVR